MRLPTPPPLLTYLLTYLFTYLLTLLVRSPGPLGSCSLVCPLGALFCVCGVLGHLAPVHRCARSVRCFACAVSWATWLLVIGVPARCVGLLVRCPGPLGSCSPVCLLGALLCVCGVLGHLAPVHRCARLVCCFACAVSWATWLLLHQCARSVRCLCVSVLGHLAPVHRCARLVRCFAFAVSWATLLLFTVVPALCVVLRVRCSGAPWLLFTGALARCAVPCPGPLGSCSPVCSPGVLCCGLRVRGVAAGRSLVHLDGCCS